LPHATVDSTRLDRWPREIASRVGRLRARHDGLARSRDAIEIVRGDVVGRSPEEEAEGEKEKPADPGRVGGFLGE